jgi:hypothetical protein
MTFIIKVRGGGKITHDYLCEEHGRFEAVVDSADAPDVVPCPVTVASAAFRLSDGVRVDGPLKCGKPSPWSPSSAPAVHTQFVVSATQGKSSPKPHRMSMDTRPLGEGQKFHDWKKERKKLWEEKRQQRVAELLK